jgi:MFS family permease
MPSIETRASWTTACVALAIMSMAYGGPLIAVVGLKSIAADLDVPRSVPALTGSFGYFGAGVGGILMGLVAERFGVRRVVLFGTVMVACGLALSSLGSVAALYAGHGLLVGMVGLGAMNAPLMVYVSRWFDRRRGSALAFVTSGQYVAGTLWPAFIERAIAAVGWQRTMLYFGVIQAVVVAVLALLFLRPAPEVIAPAPPPPVAGAAPPPRARVFGLPPNLVQAMICAAAFLCCVPMAMPSQHLVAFCTDVGLSPARGASMLSVMLASAFLSRQFWGLLADRVGGFGCAIVGSACQAAALLLYTVVRAEVPLFAVSAFFGIAFSGIIASYLLAVRQLFPARQAAWRMPLVLLTGMSGMAAGGWLAGVLYDRTGSYNAAFAAGVLFNAANLIVLCLLFARQRLGRDRERMGAALPA